MRAIFGLGSLLIVVLILGVMSAISLGVDSGTTTTLIAPTSTTAAGAGATTSTAASVSDQAAQAACVADAQSIVTAVGAYDAVNLEPLAVETTGSAPGDVTAGDPASYPTATQATKLVAGGYLGEWPGDSDGYALSLSSTAAGHVIVYVPATAREGTDFGAESATTGCNAL
jgi:hypothetical protein